MGIAQHGGKWKGLHPAGDGEALQMISSYGGFMLGNTPKSSNTRLLLDSMYTKFHGYIFA